MACGPWKVISDVVDELWKVFLDAESEHCECVLECLVEASMAEDHHHGLKMELVREA